MTQVTKDTLINEMLKRHPDIAEILMAYGLQCVNCHFSEFDTIEDGAMVHGMSDEDVELMIKDVNKILSDKK